MEAAHWGNIRVVKMLLRMKVYIYAYIKIALSHVGTAVDIDRHIHVM